MLLIYKRNMLSVSSFVEYLNTYISQPFGINETLC